MVTPRKRIPLSKVGLGAAQGQRSFSGLHKVGIPKHHRKERERKRGGGGGREEKVCYNEGRNTVANVGVALSENSYTQLQRAHHSENAFPAPSHSVST